MQLTTLPPKDTVDAWKRLFMVAKCLWARTRGGRRNEGKRKSWILRKRIQMWKDDKIDILWDNFKSQVRENRKKRQARSKSSEQKNASNKKNRICMELGIDEMKKKKEETKSKEDIRKKSRKIDRLVRNNDINKATNYMLSNGICRMDESIRKQLLEKHPGEREHVIDQKQQYAPQFKFNMDHLEKALNRIKATKSAGQDGWKPVYWKCIRESIYDSRIKKKLLKLINFCMSGRFGTDIGRHFAVARGIPIAKNKDRTQVRPVAVGLALRRLITAMITSVINPKINSIVGKLNFGTVRNGIPIFAELMNRLIRKNFELNSQPAIVEFDIKNAFNEVWRSSIRKSCKKHCPEILQFYDFVYGKHSMLYYRDGFKLMSTRGFQQGDGLASMFSLVTYDAFSRSVDFGNIKFVKFFFDDGRACDELKNMDWILTCIEDCLRTVGLRLNCRKTSNLL